MNMVHTYKYTYDVLLPYEKMLLKETSAASKQRQRHWEDKSEASLSGMSDFALSRSSWEDRDTYSLEDLKQKGETHIYPS